MQYEATPRCCRTIFYRSKCVLWFTRVFSDKFVWFSLFLDENILLINFKSHFWRWCFGYYGILEVINRSILMHYLKMTSCILLKNQKIKTLNTSSVMENSLKINGEIWIKYFRCCLWAPGLYRIRERRVCFFFSEIFPNTYPDKACFVIYKSFSGKFSNIKIY